MLAAGPGAADELERMYERTGLREMRLLIVEVLGEHRRLEHAPLLREVLAGFDAGLVAAAARSLGLIGDVEAVPRLVALLADPACPEEVRVAAAEALGAIGDPTTVRSLVAALDAPDWLVRRAAAQALADLGDAGREALAARVRPETGAVCAHAAEALAS